MGVLIPALLLATAISFTTGEEFEMIILHNNDMHARFEQTKESIDGRYVGGFARVATVVRRARKDAEDGKRPPVLFLNAGDTYTGTIWFSVHRWRIAARFLNALKPDVACLGNHEFDDGVAGLKPFVEVVDFPLVAANIDFKNETVLAENVIPYTVLDVRGRKVGIVGYLTPETKLMATIGDIAFEEEVDAIRRACKELKQEGVNIIIALGHSGFKTDQRIAREVKDVDLVIGGHTNTFLWNGPQPDKERPVDSYPSQVVQKNGKVVPVVQAYAYTKYMGELHVAFDEDGVLTRFHGQPIFLDEKVAQDQEMLDLLDEFRPTVSMYNKQVIGKSRSYLNGDDCRLKECSFGNALADSFVDYVTMMYKNGYAFWTSAAPIAIVNGGSIRTSINASAGGGNVTAGDILGAVPFHQQLVTFDLTGRDLIETLELGARSDGETSRGEFLQVAGLKVVYDFSKPRGSRVMNVRARCGRCYVPSYAPVLPDTHYRVVSTQFLLNGGDGHTVLRDKSANHTFEDVYDAEALQKYFHFYQVLTPQEEERIIVLNPPSPMLDSEESYTMAAANQQNTALRSIVLAGLVLLYAHGNVR
ncbi:Calcineurin-like phosphoesterase [Oryctes borbonicus]|uniref:Calcineurin-like phosphoesterase n=1 Tax=Oryctes borbonicus TaxID=1629725 RepID=A0A0T6BCZ4_9SCAR|nr:Calcineurin-like phosphoesterase [Oryctes borbonicus]